MDRPRTPDPLHGVTLEMMLNHLVEQQGWDALGRQIAIRCFTHEPSVKSSLAFLRKTPWARAKVERIYLRSAARSANTARRDERDSDGETREE